MRHHSFRGCILLCTKKTLGSLLKKTGTLAREDIQRLVGSKVYLQLWVKVREGWADDEKSLAAFGYSDADSSS